MPPLNNQITQEVKAVVFIYTSSMYLCNLCFIRSGDSSIFIARLTGDPVAIMLPPDATVEQMNHLRAQLGMDKPLVVQYGMFIWDLVHFNMGESIRYGEPTLSLITERLPATLSWQVHPLLSP